MGAILAQAKQRLVKLKNLFFALGLSSFGYEEARLRDSPASIGLRWLYVGYQMAT